MAKLKPKKPMRVCGNCYHENACFYAMGGCGHLSNTDATNCVNYETLQDILDNYAEIFGWEKKKMTHEDLIIQTLRGENKELKKKLADMRNELCWLCGRYKTEYDGTCEGCRWRDMA